MAEAHLAVASAVILPDPIEEHPTSSVPPKRRQSSVSEGSVKRLRYSQDRGHDPSDVASQATSAQDQPSERRRSGQLEERKRGQRLFGALLGTLSQSSSSTAQKRRTDIEKKQQAKLKLQAEEYDEKKKQQLEALMVVRRREQTKFDRQSMQIRHSNILASARFLQTQAQPKLYYKPWELLPGDDTRIKSQVMEAERMVEHELAQFEAANPGSDDDLSPDTNQNPLNGADDAAGSSETVGLANVLPEPSTSTAICDTNPDSPSTPDVPARAVEPPDVLKDHGDNGGEIVLEGEEDTVIY